MSGTPKAVGHRYRKARRMVLDASDFCHICQHPGAHTLDHLIPRSRGGAVADPANMAPAHGVGNPCPVCVRVCNQERSNNLVITQRPQSRDW